MGFIDYKGTKENRYTDVLEFAKAQQEEEARRIQDAKVGKWVTEILKDGRYAGVFLNDLVKYIIVRYRRLVELKTHLVANKPEECRLDEKILWNDFFIALVTRRLESFRLDSEKRVIYYQTILEKVFKVNGYTESQKHYKELEENSYYRQYFAYSFDLVQEKQFWRLIGRMGDKDKEMLIEFVKTYEQVSVLLGYYLFQGIRPRDLEWMQRLDIEHQVLEKLENDYSKGEFREPDYRKLQNPLYGPEKPKWEVPVEVVVEEIKKAPRLDKKAFENLLEKQELIKYSGACKLLLKCELPEKINNLYKELVERLHILQESIDKFSEVYQPDMYQFYEYYIPEALRLTATYVEYLDVGIGEKILLETEQEVLDATSQLLIAINGKVDEIYKFATMEIKAKAKALESMMSLDGYVDSKFKIN